MLLRLIVVLLSLSVLLTMASHSESAPPERPQSIVSGNQQPVSDETKEIPVRQRSIADQTRSLLILPSASLPAHDKAVCDVAYSPDGQLVATAGVDQRVMLCDATSGELRHVLTFSGPDESLFQMHPLSLAFSPQGAELAVGSSQGVQIFHADTGKLKLKLTRDELRSGDYLNYSASGDWLVSKSSSSKIKVWSIPEGKVVSEIQLENSFVDSFALTPDDKYLLMPGGKKSICMYELKTGDLAHRFESAHDAEFNHVAVSADGSLLAAADREERVIIYDLQQKKELYCSEKYPCSVLEFSPSGMLVVGFYSIDFFVLDEKEMRKVGTCSVRGATAAGKISFSPEGTRLIATDHTHQHRADLFALKWSLEEKTLVNQKTHIRALEVSPNGKWLVWADDEGLSLYSLIDQKMQLREPFKERSTVPQSLSFSSDSSLLTVKLLSDFKGVVQVRSLPDLKLMKSWPADTWGLASAQFIPDESSLLLLHDSSESLLWKTNEDSPEQEKLELKGRVARFLPGDKSRLALIDENQIHIFKWPECTEVKSW